MSVWFGPKVALSELSCSFGPGVTGLLGPNGAGKTTLMRAMTGLVGVNQGTVRVEGRDPRRDRQVHGRMALVPEDEAVPAGLTARQFVRYIADLHGVADRDAPDSALRTVAMLDVADRRVDGFSKGMRQRTKIAAALVSDPQVLVLDEPLNGADPVQRVHLIDAVQAARRGGPHRDRQLARAERGRAAGRAGDRADARPARRGRAGTARSATRWTTAPATCWCAPTTGGGWPPSLVALESVAA